MDKANFLKKLMSYEGDLQAIVVVTNKRDKKGRSIEFKSNIDECFSWVMLQPADYCYKLEFDFKY